MTVNLKKVAIVQKKICTRLHLAFIYQFMLLAMVFNSIMAPSSVWALRRFLVRRQQAMMVTSRTTITTSKVAKYTYQGTATGEIRLKWVVTIGLVYDLI